MLDAFVELETVISTLDCEREWLIWMKMLRRSPQDLVDTQNLKESS